MFRPLTEIKYNTNCHCPRRNIKNWYRKNDICGCEIYLYEPNAQCRLIKVRYRIEHTNLSPASSYVGYMPNTLKVKKKKYVYHRKKIIEIELPIIFDKLNKEDYSVSFGEIERGGETIPTIVYITINNPTAYIVAQRAEKLLNLK